MGTDFDMLDAELLGQPAALVQPWEAELPEYEPPPPPGFAGLPSFLSDDARSGLAPCPKDIKGLTGGTELEAYQQPPGFANLPRPPSTNKWDPRFIMDLALGLDELDTILTRYGLTEQEFDTLSKVPAFRRELALTIRDARENGVTFAGKARTQAEGYLEVLDALVYDPGVPASTRLEAIRSTVKWARLEVAPGEKDTGNAPAINIQINF